MIEQDDKRGFALYLRAGISLMLLLAVAAGNAVTDTGADQREIVVYEGRPGYQPVYSKMPYRGDSVLFFSPRGSGVERVALCGGGQRVAILSRTSGVPLRGSFEALYEELPRTILEVVDLDGAKVLERDINIQKFSIGPDDDMLVFITGQYIPESDLGFAPSRLGILQISTNTIEWVLDDSTTNSSLVKWQVFWADDGEIYMSDYRQLFRVNIHTHQVTPLDLKGNCHISRDGRYRIINQRRPVYDDTIKIEEMPTGVDASSSIYRLVGDVLSRDVYYIEADWFGPSGSLLMLAVEPRPEPTSGYGPAKLTGRHVYLIDVEREQVIFHEEGTDLGFGSDQTTASPQPYLLKRNDRWVLPDSDVVEKIEAAVKGAE